VPWSAPGVRIVKDDLVIAAGDSLNPIAAVVEGSISSAICMCELDHLPRLGLCLARKRMAGPSQAKREQHRGN